jgi:hypothetical protein
MNTHAERANSRWSDPAVVRTSGLTRRTTPTTMAAMAKVKRTYNLSEQTVRSVRDLSQRYGVAPTQDAVVEVAVQELERQLRYVHEARAWEGASSDPEFQAEVGDLEGAYRSADEETWPR